MMTSMMKRYRNPVRLAAVSLAFALTGSLTALALPEEGPNTEYEAALARLQDNQLEYDELEELVKNYYGPIKSAYDMLTDTGDMELVAELMYNAADDLKDQADDLEDAIKAGQVAGGDMEDAVIGIMTNKMTAKAYRKSADSMSRNIDLSTRPSRLKSAQRGVNKIVYSLQSAMNGYEQIMANRAVAAKGVEIAETARSIQQTMQAQGLAVDAGVLSAASTLSSSKAQLAALDTQAESIKKSLCSMTGWGAEGNPVIGPVPSADVAAIAEIDVNADKERAVNNNYDLISLRTSKGGGMDQIEQATTKSTTQIKNKIQNVAYSEEMVRSDIQRLYDDIVEKKASYDASSTELQNAQMIWDAAQIRKQNGSISQIEYLQQELAYLQAQASLRCADLNLRQSMENYNWAVKGLSI
ncbi:TolC family protein [Clostridium sp.]|nr:TolC family protein [Clostridium sp.]